MTEHYICNKLTWINGCINVFENSMSFEKQTKKYFFIYSNLFLVRNLVEKVSIFTGFNTSFGRTNLGFIITNKMFIRE